jgi:hypothetical protein
MTKVQSIRLRLHKGQTKTEEIADFDLEHIIMCRFIVALNSTCVALKSVCIWGRPSVHCPNDVKLSIEQKYNLQVKTKSQFTSHTSQSSYPMENNSSSQSSTYHPFEVNSLSTFEVFFEWVLTKEIQCRNH